MTASDISIEANDAYGPYNENLVLCVPKDIFIGIAELEVGMRFLAETDQGQVPVEITEINGNHVVVDSNSMLAGQSLNFYVEAITICEAIEEEPAHGHDHYHGDGCCCSNGHSHDHEHKDGGCH